MDPTLTAIYENGLHPQAKFLYGILRSYAGPDGVAVVKESLIARIMGIGPARLRGYRSALSASGYCSVALRGENIIFQMTDNHPARENSDVARESDHPDRDPDPVDNQPTRENRAVARENSDVARDSDHPSPPTTDNDPNPARESRVVARESRAVARESRAVARESRAVARARGDNRGEMFVCLFIDPTLPLLKILEKQTNKQRSAYELLTDPKIAIAPLTAADLAAGYQLEDIQRQVCAWLRDLAAGRVTSTGALINRIRNGFSARAISDEDRQSELWRTHFPDQYLPEGKNYIPDEYAHLILH